MELIRTFSTITASDVNVVGGKGANLGEMTRAGLPVPPGFCLTASAYREFIASFNGWEHIGLVLADTNVDAPEDVEQKAAAIREFLTAQEMPTAIRALVVENYQKLGVEVKGARELPVAVRSSATAEDLPNASFAGQQDTYLNIRGENALLDHVKRCWASLWTARAVTYRQKQGFPHEQVALAVVVQAMVEADIAGVLFTANPVNHARDEIVINSSWGLGEAIVSGFVTPDTFIIRKNDLAVIEREIASKDVAIEYDASGGTVETQVPPAKRTISSLSDEQLRELVALGIHVEQHYRAPMDIEWAWIAERRKQEAEGRRQGAGGRRQEADGESQIGDSRWQIAHGDSRIANRESQSAKVGKFYVLQARPITTLGDEGRVVPTDGAARSEKREAVDGRDTRLAIGDTPSAIPDLPSSIRDKRIPATGEYNRTMFLEIFPDPLSPAFLDVIQHLFKDMLDYTFVTLGFRPPQDIDAVGLFYNQPYFHREYIAAALASLSPTVREGLVARIVNPFSRQDGGESRELSPAYLGMTARLLRFMVTFPNQLPKILEGYRVEVRAAEQKDVAAMSDAQIVKQVRELIFGTANRMLSADFLAIALIGVTYRELASLLQGYFGDETETVRGKLISGVTGNVTMEANKRLWDLAQVAKRSPTVTQVIQKPGFSTSMRAELEQTPEGREFLRALDDFLREFGHREIKMDIIYPTWSEDPAPILAFIRGYLDANEASSPHWQQERLQQERAEAQQLVRERVGRDFKGRYLVLPLFNWVLDHTTKHTRERDTMHFELTRVFPPFRRMLLELGARFTKQGILAIPDDIFFLSLDEMDKLAANPRPMQELVQVRRAEFEWNREHPAPAILRDGTPVGEEEHAAVSDSSTEYRGIAGSPGRVTGVTRVIRGPEEFDKLQHGDILVAPLTNPVWTPLFAIAGGIVTEVGGILSHGAIVAREYGIPAVMAVKGATQVLGDGQRVTVDGNKGVVYVEM